jgi:hypothetical protein
VADAAGYSAAFGVSAIVCALPVLVVLSAPETLRAGDDALARSSTGDTGDAGDFA